MNRFRPVPILLLATLIFGVAVSALGQVATGSPPFGSYGNGPDVINLANLNAHITVPVVHKAGRAMAFSYDLIYDTSVWTPVTSGSTRTWQPASNWGWGASTQVETGYLSANVTNPTECGFWKNLGGGNQIWIVTGEIYDYSNWRYVDRFGQSHPFSGTTTHFTGSVAPCLGTDTSINTVTTDGSGYTLKATGGGGTVIARNGTVALPQTNSGSGSATKTDRNGNQISVSSSEVFTDTLGTTALTISGGAPSPLVFTYVAPSGANAAYTVKYTSLTILTNFGCTGVSEFSAANVPLVTEIDLPDQAVNPSDKFTITYEPTYGNPGKYTGRIASITLPTGGAISYSYGTGGANGITCADGSAPSLTRTTPDGAWSYTHSESGTAWTTLVQDPQGNQTNINFQGIYETERQIYEGLTSGTLLETVFTCYNSSVPNCNSTPITLPITERIVDIQWPGTSGKHSRTTNLYNSYGLITESDEYDYGNGVPPSTPTRKTVTAYATLGNGIVDLPSSATVYDGTGSVKAQKTFSYDQSAVTSTTGTPQHTSISGARGNLTSVTSLVQGTATLNRTYTYFDTGNIQTTTDVNGAQATYAYGACGNSFVTSIGSINLPSGFSKSMTWNCTGGVETSATDENGQTVSSSYTADPYFWRMNAVTDELTNSTNMTYHSQNSSEGSLVYGSSTNDVLVTSDSLGRRHISQAREGPSSGTYDSVEIDYDSLGRPSRTTLPYAASANQLCTGTCASKTTSYDPLGRTTQITDTAGGSLAYSYSQNDASETLGPHPTGENSKQKQFEFNSFGKLTSVCEITGGSGSGTCGQTTSMTGFWTKYTYDVLGNLTGVTQNAQSSSNQSRGYSYDALGRITSQSSPESATSTFVYDTDTTCGTYRGDLVKKTDAAGNVTCYQYDALHRLTRMFISSGQYASVTPTKVFVYDAATVNGIAMANVKGRLAEAYTCTSSCTSKITDIGMSYTDRGEISDVYESTPHSSGYYRVSASYFPNGAINQLSNLVGLPTMTSTLDGEGRLYAVSASTGQNPLVSTTYSVASLPTQVTLGSSDSDSFTFDPNSNRMTQYKFNVNGQSLIGNLVWNPIGTLGSLAITDPFNVPNNQTCSYTHDDSSRIASVNCGSPWSQTFSYDAFGNLAKSGTNSFQPTYSYLTNHMTQIGGSSPSYDTNGNVTNDFLHAYSWDAAGRPITIDGIGVTYDALGRMVEQNRSGTFTEIVYSPGGAKLALMNGQTLQKAFIQLSGGSAAIYNSSGLSYYRHSDWLGSSRLASTPSRSVYSDSAYGPFGEAYAQSGTTDLSFTGMNQDTVPNLYDFPAREYGIQGRWPSPDPASAASLNLTDPQTFNGYAYVRNSPMHLVDPTGLCPDWHGTPFAPQGKVICTSASELGGGDDDGLFFIMDGIELPGFMNQAIENMMAVDTGFAACPYNTCTVSTDSGDAHYTAYADGSAGYETGDFLGYTPNDIMGTVHAIIYAIQAQPVQLKDLNSDQQSLVAKLAAALGVSEDQLTLYRGPDQGISVMAPSESLANLDANKIYQGTAMGSSIFHGVFSVDSRENTPNGMNSLHITMLDPGLVSAIGWGSEAFIYIGDLHNDLYNLNQNPIGHFCQVLLLCH